MPEYYICDCDCDWVGVTGEGVSVVGVTCGGVQSIIISVVGVAGEVYLWWVWCVTGEGVYIWGGDGW